VRGFLRKAAPAALRAVSIEKTEEEWKEILRPEQFNVLRKEGTESPWSSPLNEVEEDGVFRCAGCSSPLFPSNSKFESGSGWPSFYAPIDADAVGLSVDYKMVLPRTEVTCKSCGGHLGHVFDDGPQPTGKRYCMNGVAMDFRSNAEDPDLAESVSQRLERAGPGAIEQPLMAVLPGLALDAIIAGLFITSFIDKNEGDGWELLSNGVGVGQLLQLIPLGIGGFYAASALRKVAGLILPSNE